MPNTINIDADTGANMIGDDAQPTLRLENSSTGPGLSVDRLLGTSGATITSNTTTGVGLNVGRTVVGSPTVAIVSINLGSTASAPVFELVNQGFVSAVSIVFAASGNWAGLGALRVKHGDVYKWITLLPDAVVTAAAR